MPNMGDRGPFYVTDPNARYAWSANREDRRGHSVLAIFGQGSQIALRCVVSPLFYVSISIHPFIPTPS